MAKRRTVTPRYLFDPRLGKTGRYVNAATGRLVSWNDVRGAMERRISGSRQRVNQIGRSLAVGDISLADWQTQMRDELKIIHTMAGAIGKGGWQNMTQADWGAVGQISREQYGYLQRFAIDIETGRQPITRPDGTPNGQFLRRADMYSQAGRGTQAQIERRTANQSGATEERRVRVASDSCETCISEAAKGWQPLGTLRRIGDTVCKTNDRCYFEYR